MAAVTICVSSLKGGVGKSTLSANLASALYRAGHKTLGVDADSQGTFRTWAQVAARAGLEGPPVVALEGAALRRDLPKVSEGFAAVVIDAPPRLGLEAKAAMLAADLVLMPCTPGAGDVWALRQTLDAFAEAQALRPELRGVVVLNRDGRSNLTRMTTKALEGSGVRLLEVTIGDRVAFGEAMAAGQGAIDYAPSSDAAREARRLAKAVLSEIGGGR
jgi:chromosome partitioning protein